MMKKMLMGTALCGAAMLTSCCHGGDGDCDFKDHGMPERNWEE